MRGELWQVVMGRLHLLRNEKSSLKNMVNGNLQVLCVFHHTRLNMINQRLLVIFAELGILANDVDLFSPIFVFVVVVSGGSKDESDGGKFPIYLSIH